MSNEELRQLKQEYIQTELEYSELKIKYAELQEQYNELNKFTNSQCYKLLSWDWIDYDYRVKEEPKYRPYKDTEEMINDFCNRFSIKRTSFGEPFIWIRLKVNTTSKHIITDIYIDGVSLSSDYIDLDTLFNNYTFLNGSPCGIKE